MSRDLDIHSDISAQVLEEAATWFVSLADASADEAERKRWRAWLTEHPDHARAWKRLEEVTRQFAPLAGMGRSAGDALEAPRRRSRRSVLKALGIVLLTGAGGVGALRLPWQDWRHELALYRADYRTRIGEIRALTLADGSQLWLGSQSALDIAYTASLRRLALYQGDVLIETARDSELPARPFVVETSHGRLRALGTRFAVRTGATDSRVDVFEGAVEITLDGPAHATHILQAGEHALFDGDALKSIGRADPSREAWSRGILLADRMRLDDLVAELGRWHSQPVACSPDVGGLLVVGAFPLKDLDHILAKLQDNFPVRVLRDGKVMRIVAAAPAASVPVTPPRRLQ